MKKDFICDNCDKVFQAWPSHRTGKSNFCSVICRRESKKFSEIMSVSRIGIKFSQQHLKNLSLSHVGVQKGKNNGMWKGDKVGYFSLHNWIKREMGRPEKCTECGLKNVREGRSIIEWSNQDHKYHRDVKDWKPLCKKCHEAYDHSTVH